MCTRKRDRFFSVDNAVVVAEGEIHHGANDNLIVDDNGALDDVVHAENAALRRIENRSREERAENAAIRDRERAPLHIIDGDRPVSRFFCKVFQLFLDFGIGAADLHCGSRGP